MRDINRIYPFLCQIAGDWSDHCPDLRFGQLMINFMEWHIRIYGADVFYLEEEDFKKRFKKYLDTF